MHNIKSLVKSTVKSWLNAFTKKRVGLGLRLDTNLQAINRAAKSGNAAAFSD